MSCITMSELLSRNHRYELCHVDPESGYGLLYSESPRECIFLNTVGTSLWNALHEPLHAGLVARLAADHLCFAGPDDERYLQDIIGKMRSSGVLQEVGDNGRRTSAETTGPYPLQQIYFYVTRECNARCYHCYQPTRRRAEGGVGSAAILSAEAFVALAAEALPLGLMSVKLTGGEPLLRADIAPLVRALKQLGVSVSVETNGYFLDERMADLFAAEAVDVSISLDAGSAALHDSLRGLPGSFERVTRGLRLLSERRASPKAIMAVSRRNVNEVEAVIRVARENGCQLIKLNPVNTLGLARRLSGRNVLLNSAEIAALYTRRRELETRYGVFVFLEGPPAFATIFELATGHAAVCPFRNLLGVLSDGSLSFCGVGNSYPELVFGRVGSSGFELAECWTHATLLNGARQALEQQPEGVCGACVLQPFCRGSCRALAYGEFGRFSAPHPWCEEAMREERFPVGYLKPPERR